MEKRTFKFLIWKIMNNRFFQYAVCIAAGFLLANHTKIEAAWDHLMHVEADHDAMQKEMQRQAERDAQERKRQEEEKQRKAEEEKRKQEEKKRQEELDRRREEERKAREEHFQAQQRELDKILKG